MGPLDAFVLDPQSTRDLRPEVLGPDGRLRVLPASYWQGTTKQERGLLGHRLGVYSFPTVELVEWVADIIAGRPALEIGAGHGVFADALGILGTDNMMQADPAIQALYSAHGQPTVTYGPDVERLEASAAVKRHRPRVVVACWVTHRWDARHPERGGNMYGARLPAIVAAVDTFVFIGNAAVHKHSPIWHKPHEVYRYPWIVSRSQNDDLEFAAVFERS